MVEKKGMNDGPGTEPAAKQATVSIIFVGGAGGNAGEGFLSRTDPTEMPLVFPAILDLDSANLEAREARIRGGENVASHAWFGADTPNKCVLLQLGNDAGSQRKGLGAGGDPQVGLEAAQASMDKIEEIIEKGDIVLILGGVGGGTGTGAIQAIAEKSKALDKITICMIAKPSAREGMRTLYANEAHHKLLQTVPTVVIYNENLYQVLMKDTDKRSFSHREAYDFMNSLSFDPLLNVFLLLSTEVGFINIDAMDLRSLCGYGNLLIVSFAVIGDESETRSGRNNETQIDVIYRELTTNRFQESEALKNAKAYMLALTGSRVNFMMDANLHAKLSEMFGTVSNDVHTCTGIFPEDPENVAILVAAVPYEAGEPTEAPVRPRRESRQLSAAAPLALEPIKAEPLPLVQRPVTIRYRGADQKDYTVHVTADTKKAWDDLSNLPPFESDPAVREDRYKHVEALVQKVRVESGNHDVLAPPHLRRPQDVATRNGASAMTQNA